MTLRRNEVASLLAALAEPKLNKVSLFRSNENIFIVFVMVTISVSKCSLYFLFYLVFDLTVHFPFWPISDL